MDKRMQSDLIDDCLLVQSYWLSCGRFALADVAKDMADGLAVAGVLWPTYTHYVDEIRSHAAAHAERANEGAE